MAEETINNMPSGVLTKDEIKSLEIIQLDQGQEMHESCYENASYNLRLGEEYYRPSIDNRCNSRTPSKLDEYPQCPNREYLLSNEIKNCKEDNLVVRIKPYTSIVISTYEKLNLPNNVVGRFDLTIRWALQGLILQVGTQVAPGYKGRLYGLLHNLSKKEICIPMKMGILDAEFSYTSKTQTPREFDETYNTLAGFLKNRPPIEGTLEAFLNEIMDEKEEMVKMKEEASKMKVDLDNSLNEMKSELEKNKNELTSARKHNQTIFFAIIGGLLTLAFSIGIPLIITKFTVDKDDYPFRKVYEIETRNDELYMKLDSMLEGNRKTNYYIDNLNNKIKDLEEQLNKQEVLPKREIQ